MVVIRSPLVSIGGHDWAFASAWRPDHPRSLRPHGRTLEMRECGLSQERSRRVGGGPATQALGSLLLAPPPGFHLNPWHASGLSERPTQQELDLPVDAAQVVGGPAGERLEQSRIDTQEIWFSLGHGFTGTDRQALPALPGRRRSSSRTQALLNLELHPFARSRYGRRRVPQTSSSATEMKRATPPGRPTSLMPSPAVGSKSNTKVSHEAPVDPA